MRRVDEQYVAARELPKDLERHILNVSLEYTSNSRYLVAQKIARIRLNARDIDLAVQEASIHVCHQQRRIARTYFDNPFWSPLAQQHKQNGCIEPAKLGIVDVKRRRPRRAVEFDGIVELRDVFGENFGKNSPMDLIV